MRVDMKIATHLLVVFVLCTFVGACSSTSSSSSMPSIPTPSSESSSSSSEQSNSESTSKEKSSSSEHWLFVFRAIYCHNVVTINRLIWGHHVFIALSTNNTLDDLFDPGSFDIAERQGQCGWGSG